MKTKTYGFTTTESDFFLSRIAQEAKPTDHFLVVTNKDTANGEHLIHVLIREEKRAGMPADATLFGFSLKRWKGSSVKGTEFRSFSCHASDLKRLSARVHSEVTRIKNVMLGRTRRVMVESL